MSEEINQLNTKFNRLRNEMRHMKKKSTSGSFRSYQMTPEIQTLKEEIESLKLNRNVANIKEQKMKVNDNCCEDVKQILDKIVKEKEQEKKDQEKKEITNNINDLKTKVDTLLKEKEKEKKKQELKENDKCCEEIKATLGQLLKEKNDKENKKGKEVVLKENDKSCEEIKKLLENLIQEEKELKKEKDKTENNTCLEELRTLKEEITKLKQIHQDLEMVIGENKKKEEEKAKQVCMDEIKKLKEEIERVAKPQPKDKLPSCQDEVNKLKEEIDRLKNLVKEENRQKEKNTKDKQDDHCQDELYKQISKKLRDKCSEMYKEELAKITGNKNKDGSDDKDNQTFQKLVLDLLTKLVKDDKGDENGKEKGVDPESKATKELKDKLDKMINEFKRIKLPKNDIETNCAAIIKRLNEKNLQYNAKEQENLNLISDIAEFKNKIVTLDVEKFGEDTKKILVAELEKITNEKDKNLVGDDDLSSNKP